MTDPRKNSFEKTTELADRMPLYAFDFDKVQVAPQRNMPVFVEFKALSLAERQALLEKLIDRVKSL